MKESQLNLMVLKKLHKPTAIPSLLINNEFVTNISDKANLFNNFFRKQCRPIANDSSVPNRTLEL